MAWGNQAAALEALGKLEEAEADYKRSAELLMKLGEDDLHARVMQSLSALQMKQGRQMEALGSMQAGVSGIKRPNLRQRLLKRLLKLPNKLLKH